jgi:hypothetical protein
MCTVSWVHTDDGYRLLCNRDEKNTRLPASMPEVHFSGGVQYVSPLDGDFGGSWVATNEYGLTIALLNGPVNAPRGTLRGSKSRGHLVTELAGARSRENVRRQMLEEDLGSLACLSLVVLEPGEPALLFEWDGWHLTSTENAEHRMPLTSSSFDSRGVQEARLQEFSSRLRAAQTLDADLLFEFHRSHGLGIDQQSAYSVCMHRSDAQTVSFTWIDVSKSDVRFFYSPAAPCKWAPGESVSLPRKINAYAVSR